MSSASTPVPADHADVVENWDTDTLILHLKEQNLKLDEDDFAILREEKIVGQDFIDMTEDDFRSIGLSFGPAARFAKEAENLKENQDRSFSSDSSFEKILAKYDIDSNDMDTIPLFSLQTHEIQDSDKHFEYCIDNILFKMKHYGSLVLNSPESMRNEYVSTILHTALHIAGDATNKGFSMRLKCGINGEENYVIKGDENLLCVAGDMIRFGIFESIAQSIRQFESLYEMNKRKRKRDGDDYDYLYGIITTASDWYFLLYTPGVISQASEIPFSIEFNKKALDKNSKEYQMLCGSVKEILSIIVGLIKDRACSNEEPEKKRAKIELYRSKK
ncbi:hypothetical protein RclHR1_15980005 [Rhizophagus clarus]|uniref:SAM domain-containing protein n=1 Tax=Rhizophagus clarus TaxID=94130 RepID=A0A2Z6QU32_9GLOM|nr:hypothetical protein RclHR1_15980005 [Rhizophagus clarus]GES78657.1 hypothetical protein GLOIN_2v1587390 [Rhizophagus clarus]